VRRAPPSLGESEPASSPPPEPATDAERRRRHPPVATKPERLIARHEAGHAVARVLVLQTTAFVVTIDPPAKERKRRTRGLLRSIRPSMPPEAMPGLRGRDLRELLRISGIHNYAGLAAEYPNAVGFPWNETHQADLTQLVELAALHGRARPPIHYPSWRRACAFVDVYWTAIEAVAAALLAERTLTGPRVLDLIEIAAQGPKVPNVRPRW